MISPCTRLFRFSSSNAIAAKTFSKFQEKYSAHLESFKKKTSSTQRESEAIKRSTQKGYVHPHDDLHHRPYYSVMHTLQTYVDLYGAEQVSPHYENLGMARKDALLFWGGYFALAFAATSPDFHFYAQTGLTSWCFTFAFLYWFLEGKKSVAMPLLNRFYRKIAQMEMTNLETYYAENIEARVRTLMANARSQIEFKSLHGDYLSVRNNTLLSVSYVLFAVLDQ